MTIENRLVRLIETGGPIPLSTYMQIALHDPQDGITPRGRASGGTSPPRRRPARFSAS
jgi:hypothetical protein